MKQFKVVRNRDLYKFEKDVNDRLSNGWELVGGSFTSVTKSNGDTSIDIYSSSGAFTYTNYCQSIIKE